MICYQLKPSKWIVVMPTGCHEKGYELLRAGMEPVKVEDIVVGDSLLGPDFNNVCDIAPY